MITLAILEPLMHSPLHDVAIRAVDRLNLLTGIILLSCGLYLRFVTQYNVPRIYEYAYMVTGVVFFVNGMFRAGDLDTYVLVVRVTKQITVSYFAFAMFRHLIITTSIDPPSQRIPEAVRDAIRTVRG